jgi:hypothetical protein
MAVARASYWSLRRCPIAERQTHVPPAAFSLFDSDGFHDTASNAVVDLRLQVCA